MQAKKGPAKSDARVPLNSCEHVQLCKKWHSGINFQQEHKNDTAFDRIQEEVGASDKTVKP